VGQYIVPEFSCAGGSTISPSSDKATEGGQTYDQRNLATVHARVGDPDVAIDLLKKLTEFTGAYTFALIDMDPLLEPLHTHPRYRELQ
jgi:hypothetical protein